MESQSHNSIIMEKEIGLCNQIGDLPGYGSFYQEGVEILDKLVKKPTPKKSQVKKKITKAKLKKKDSSHDLERRKTASSETQGYEASNFNQNEELLKEQKRGDQMDEIFNMSQDNLKEEDLIDNTSIYHNGNPINSLNCQKENDFGLLFESDSVIGNSIYEENGYNGNFNFMSSEN